MKASMEAFPVVTSMEAFVEASWMLAWMLILWKLSNLAYLSCNLSRNLSWTFPCKLFL